MSNETPPESDPAALTRQSKRAVNEPRKKRRVMIASIVAGAVLLGGGGTAIALLNQGGEKPTAADTSTPSATPEKTSTPTPTPTPTPTTPPDADLARTAAFRATVGQWELRESPELAAVMPAAGSAHTGQVSIGIEAPALRTPTDALVTWAQVQPGATYDAQVWVRTQQKEAAVVGAELSFGDVIVPIPESNADWQLIEAEIPIPDGVSTIPVIVRVTAPLTTSLYVDDFSLVASDGVNVVPNPSYEEIEVPQQGILNDSLVMTTDVATVAASLAAGEGSWEVRGVDDAVIAGGLVQSEGAITAIPLEAVPQGYHTLTVNSSDGAAATTPIAVIDTEGAAVPVDHRFGVTAQFDRDWHHGASRLATAIGYGEMHSDLLWHLNEPARGTYNWDERYVREFADVRAQGMGMTGVIVYGNDIYDGRRIVNSPEAIEAFGRYAAAAAGALPLTSLEVYNEFNMEGFNKGSCGLTASCYLPLLESAYRQVKAVNPDLTIIGGVTARYDQAFFQALWQSGGMDYMDVVSYHPYEGWLSLNPDVMEPIAAQAVADMQQHAGKTKPVWITEMGFTTMIGGATDEQQRDWLIRSEVLAFGGGVEKYMWYDIVDDSADPAHGEGNFGLYEHDPRRNVVARPPKPAAYSQALLIAQLNGRAFSVNESSESVKAFVFGDAADPLRIAWAPSGQGELLYPSTDDVSVVTIDGKTTVIEAVDGQVTVPLTDAPSFISVVESDEDDSPATPTPSPKQSNTPEPTDSAKPKEDDEN